jgi:ribosomal protein RSM22 (predicted rRNA methylase)
MHINLNFKNENKETTSQFTIVHDVENSQLWINAGEYYNETSDFLPFTAHKLSREDVLKIKKFIENINLEELN